MPLSIERVRGGLVMAMALTSLGASALIPAAAAESADTVGAALWQPSMNVFRRFAVEPEAMYQFYGGVLGLEQLSTFAVGNGGVVRFRAGGSELKLTRRVPDRGYVPGGVQAATGVRLVTLFYADAAPLAARFREHGLAVPKFEPVPASGRTAALVQDPDGQAVELVVVPGATPEVLAQIEVGVTVSDIATSRAFYRDFVGLAELPPVADPLFGTTKYPFRHGSTTVVLRFFGRLPADTGSGGIQYVVSNVDLVDALAKERNVAIDQPLRAFVGVRLRTIWLDDPDGNTNYFAETAVSRAARQDR